MEEYRYEHNLHTRKVQVSKQLEKAVCHFTSGGATPGHARSNDLAGRSIGLAPLCLALKNALLR